MRSGKEHARQTQPVIPDEGSRVPATAPVASTSGPSTSREVASGSNIQEDTVGQPSFTQPSDQDTTRSGISARSISETNSGVYQDVLVECNKLVEGYRKGEISKVSTYVEIQSRLAKALGDDRARSDAAFRSFIATIESHDSEVTAASGRAMPINPLQRSPSPPLSISDGHLSDDEPTTKKIKIDESAYAWVSGRQDKRIVLRDSLAKTLKLIEIYTVDPKTTKRSLVNEPDCPEFPDSEWKHIITGRAVNLDAVLSGQLSTTHDDPKVEKFGDLEISFGAIEPSKIVKNGGDWSIAWNRTV